MRTHEKKFYKQKVLEPYILDFYCPAARLVIELDGSQHYEPEQARYDAERTQFLQQRGIAVLRFPNNDVNERFRGVCEEINRVLELRIPK